MSQITFAAIGLQIIAPVGGLDIRLVCRRTDVGLEPFMVSEPNYTKSTAWTPKLRFPIQDLVPLPLIKERLELSFSNTMSRVTNAVYLYGQGMRSAESRIRTLLWCIGLDTVLK